MFQKFFTDTLMSRFIKNLLSKETIPLINTVIDGDVIIGGCIYIYKSLVIKCIKTGKLTVSADEWLYPSDTLYPSEVLFPETGYEPATFKVLSYYNDDTAEKFSYHYNSTEHFYDGETHRYLGEYLRYLRGNKGLDLLPFYNCYTAQEIDDVYLNASTLGPLYPAEDLYPDNSVFPGSVRIQTGSNRSKTYELGNDSSKRVIIVPIKFGQQYTIAVECATTVILRSIIYNPRAGMIKEPNTESSYYSDRLNSSYMLKGVAHFSEPFLYSVETRDKGLYDLEHCLYLVIQLPVDNTSSIVVLEGNYTNLDAVTTSDLAPDYKGGVRKYSIYKNLSLLQLNTKSSYAFSDRLIEYLLDNVITAQDEYSTDIAEVQKSLYKIDSTYRKAIDSNHVREGIWDDTIKNAIFRTIEKTEHERYFVDQDGNINKDVEQLLVTLGGYR